MRAVSSRIVRGLGVVALAATMAAPATAAESGRQGPPPVELRVASYNIHAGAGQDNVFDLDRTAAAIAELDADVVGLQEVDVHWGARSNNLDTAAELGKRLNMHVCFAPIYSFDPVTEGGPRREYGVAVLSRYPMLECTNHDLTRLSTQEANPVPAPAPGFAEAVIQAKGARVHVYSTHLDYRGDPTVRRLQVADTLRILGEDREGATQVLTGDFNASPEKPEIAPLLTSLTDTFAVAGSGDGRTYNAAKPSSRIDYVTVSSRVSVHGAHVPATLLARTASDHRPTVADVEVPRGVQR